MKRGQLILQTICVFLFILFFTAFPVYSQIDVEILISPTLELAQKVYYSHFNFFKKGSAQFIFQVRISSSVTVPAVYAEMKVEKVGEGEIAYAKTSVFQLPAGTHFINNVQLMNGYLFDPSNPETEIEFTDIRIDFPTDDFEQQALQGGVLERGKYIISLNFTQTFTGLSKSALAPFGDNITLNVLNPSYIKPVAPGVQSGTGEPETVYTEFPVFQFDTDFQNIQTLVDEPFLVQVFKKLEQHNSDDEVLSTTPHLEFITENTVFQYPASGAQPLDPGTYIWRILMNIRTSGGIETLSSPIFVFKVEDPSTGNENLEDQTVAFNILQMIRRLAGSSAEDVIKKLDSYKLKTIRVNGEIITAQQLYDIIDSYEDHTIEISDLVLQSTQN